MLSHELRAACQIVSLAGLFFSILMYFPWIVSVIFSWEGERLFLVSNNF